MQVSFHITNGRWSHVNRNVTVQRGSWKWQDAFRSQGYVPRQGRHGFFWMSHASFRGSKTPIAKWANTQMTRNAWGSLHNRPAVVGGIDDHGNLFFVVD